MPYGILHHQPTNPKALDRHIPVIKINATSLMELFFDKAFTCVRQREAMLIQYLWDYILIIIKEFLYVYSLVQLFVFLLTDVLSSFYQYIV